MSAAPLSGAASPGITICATGTTYDFQQNDLAQKQIATIGGDPNTANVHFAWTFWDVIPDSLNQINRFVNYNGYTPAAGLCLGDCGVTVSGAGADPTKARAGYVNVDVASNDNAILFYHQRNEANQDPGSDQRYSSFAQEQFLPCFNLFQEMELPNSNPGEAIWPHGAVDRGGDIVVPGDDVYHVTSHPTGDWPPFDDEIYYWRRTASDFAWDGPCVLDTNSGALNHYVAADPTSQDVAVIYLRDQTPGNPDALQQVVFMRSMLNGTDWIAAGAPAFPTPLTSLGFSYTQVTTYADPTGPEAWVECGGEYDLDGALHVLWVEQLSAGGTPDCRLKHWSAVTGFSTVTQAIGWGNQGGNGGRDLWLAYPGIAFGDGQTLCTDGPVNPGSGGATSNRNYVYYLFEQYGGPTAAEQADVSANANQQNLEFYLSASNDGGGTWSPSVNLTNTRTPGCTGTPGSPCASERDPSMALVVNDAIHIQYILDIDAGDAVFGQGDWTFNPVMYYKVPGGTDAPLLCPDMLPGFSAYLSDANPDCDYTTALEPPGSVEETLTVYNLGNTGLSGAIATGGSDWLLVGSGSYFILPGDSLVSTVIMDAGAPSVQVGGEGLYQDSIVITHNDPAQPNPHIIHVDFLVSNIYPCWTDFVILCGGPSSVVCGDTATLDAGVFGGIPPLTFVLTQGPGTVDAAGHWEYPTNCLTAPDTAEVEIEAIDAADDTARCSFQLTIETRPAGGCSCPYQGDYDADGFLTSLDLSTLIDVLFAGTPDIQDEQCPSPRGDLDCDLFTTALDLAILIDHLFAGGDGPCVPCDDAPVQPVCDNCHDVNHTVNECAHFTTADNLEECQKHLCIVDKFSTATCDHHNTDGPNKCKAVLSIPQSAEVVQELRRHENCNKSGQFHDWAGTDIWFGFPECTHQPAYKIRCDNPSCDGQLIPGQVSGRGWKKVCLP